MEAFQFTNQSFSFRKSHNASEGAYYRTYTEAYHRTYTGAHIISNSSPDNPNNITYHASTNVPSSRKHNRTGQNIIVS
jgi:hypothetical protein